MEFERNPNGSNELLNGEGFYISYNPAPCAGLSCFESDTGGSETALVIPNDPETEFRILNGDFRKDYKSLAPDGVAGCLAFYERMKPTHDSSWSGQ